MAQYGSFKEAFQNGVLKIYSGAQPATADAAVNTGTLLCTVSNNSGAVTSEVLASGTVTLTGGSSGSVSSITVNGIEILNATIAFDTSLTQTAADCAAQINNNQGSVDYVASSSGAVITITALPGTGSAPNTFAVLSTTTTITHSVANLAGGVTAVNGLSFGSAASASIAKLASQTWTGVNGAGGVAGYYVFYGSVADAGNADTNLQYIRECGAIATSGAELNLLNTTTLVNVATTTIPAWSRTLPTN
jgi:hypothetical protein